MKAVHIIKTCFFVCSTLDFVEIACLHGSYCGHDLSMHNANAQ